MKIEYINTTMHSYCDEDASFEEYIYYYDFFVDNNLDHILEIHLNSCYGDFISDHFRDIDDYPQNFTRDNYNVTVNVFTNLDEEMYYYYSRARKIGEDIKVIQKYSDDLSNIRIQFNDNDYLTFEEALNQIRTIFLKQIPKMILFEFTKSLIFESNFRTTPGESLFKQKNELEDTLNYSAFIYFMQKDLTTLNIKDLYRIKNDFLGLNIYLNPFFDQQKEIKEAIRDIFYDTDRVGIKKAKYVTKRERLKRIFYVYLMTEYPQIYFDDERKTMVENTEIYLELRKLGYIFHECDTNNGDIYSVSVPSQVNRHILNDKKIIKDIKKIKINFDDTLYNLKVN